LLIKPSKEASSKGMVAGYTSLYSGMKLEGGPADALVPSGGSRTLDHGYKFFNFINY